MICEKCGKEHDGTYGSGRFCSGKCAHSRIRTPEIKQKISLKLKKPAPYLKTCNNCGVVLSKHNKSGYCKKCFSKSEYYSNSLKQAFKNKNMGGYRKGSGRGKCGWYKGYWCDSSWELAYVIYNLEHNIVFERNTRKFEYEYEGKKLKYLPDFIKDGKYIEIKGYSNKQWEAKVAQFPKDETLIVLMYNEMKPYLDYVIKKYGNDYIKLYENKKLEQNIIDYTKYHWWTNVETNKHTWFKGCLSYPWKLGRK